MDTWRKIMAASVPAAMGAGIAIAFVTTGAPATGSAAGRTDGQAAAQAAVTGQGAGAIGAANAAGSNGQLDSAPGADSGSGSTGGAGSSGESGNPTSGPSSTATPTAGGSPSATSTVQYTNPFSTPTIKITYIPKAPATIPPPIATGPTCLMGYVWRQAVPGDYVCVTPATRSQAAADNAAAAGRVDPEGAYGPDSCDYGYVWRQVVPTDYVCVTPATRSQAAADNSQALNRELLMQLWLSDWTPPTPPQNCSGDICSVTEGGGGVNFQVNGMSFNYGKVMLVIKQDSDNVTEWSTTVVAGPHTGFYGGVVAAYTPLMDCSSDPYATPNDYLQAYDEVSGQWSAKYPVNSDCASY
jgi:hypothetical protein